MEYPNWKICLGFKILHRVIKPMEGGVWWRLCEPSTLIKNQVHAQGSTDLMLQTINTLGIDKSTHTHDQEGCSTFTRTWKGPIQGDCHFGSLWKVHLQAFNNTKSCFWKSRSSREEFAYLLHSDWARVDESRVRKHSGVNTKGDCSVLVSGAEL